MPIVRVLDDNFPSFTSCCLSVRNKSVCPSGYRELSQFILKGVRDDGNKSRAEVYKQDPHKSLVCPDEVQSHVDSIVHRPVCSVGKLEGVH